jgi:hypothetical protein
VSCHRDASRIDAVHTLQGSQPCHDVVEVIGGQENQLQAPPGLLASRFRFAIEDVSHEFTLGCG